LEKYKILYTSQAAAKLWYSKHLRIVRTKTPKKIKKEWENSNSFIFEARRT